MTREDTSDDNFLQRLSMKSSHHDRSSASAMVTNELMMATIQRLHDDMVDTLVCSDKEDDENLDSFEMAKRAETSVDITSDAGAFSPQLSVQKQIDPPEENDVETGTTTSHRNSRNKMHISASNHRDRYRRMNTDGNPKMYAQNSTGVDSKQHYRRRYTDPCYTAVKERDKRKPDPIGTVSTRLTCNRKSAPFSDEDSLLELARRMSKSCGIEDTLSIEGPTDNYYWANSKHSSAINDSGSSCKDRSRRRKSARSSYRSRSRRSVRSKKKHWYDDDEYDFEGRQHSKMKGLFHLITRKSNRKRGMHRHNRDEIRRSRSMSSSKCSSRRSSRNNNRGGSSSYSLSSNYSRQSSRKSVNSSYSSSSRRKTLSVAEAVAYLNKTERMTKSPSQSSFRSPSSIKSSASKLSSISRNSRRSSVSTKSSGGKNTTVSRVVSVASGLKKKIQRRVV